MIALDLCQPHHQNLLIIYLKIISKNVEIKTTNLRLSLKSLKIIFLYNSKGCRIKQSKPINGLIKKFPNTYIFCNNDIKKRHLSIRIHG